ncbi:replication initiation protein [Levilactobacillus namurensis]|uniref:replication initiation protein n=1 Tax=Levilactobacillus namurensis TaxID=380393 RepID=UPI0022873B3B|nr:replication initiation protein [Levilactobacillus namurensis]
MLPEIQASFKDLKQFLKNFTAVEMNLFFSIVSRMRDQGDKKVSFSFEQLKDLSVYKPTANKRFVDDLVSTSKKLIGLQFSNRSKTGLSHKIFVMFTEFDVDGDSKTPHVDVKLSEQALPLLNNLDVWVRYSLTEFRELKSNYSKTAFRLLKQFRTTGKLDLKADDFREILDIPSSYKGGDIDRRVLRPIREELTPLFRGLTIRKRYGKRRGKPVIGYVFTFAPEPNDKDDFSQGPVETKRKQIFNVKYSNELDEKTKGKIIDKINEKYDS